MKNNLILATLLLICLSYPHQVEGGKKKMTLVEAIIHMESRGNPDAIGPNGEIGLMQISPIVLEEYNHFNKYKYTSKQLFNAQINMKIGVWYLKRIRDHYLPKGFRTVENILAAYGGGISNLRAAGYNYSKLPQRTKNYVQKVTKIMNNENS